MINIKNNILSQEELHCLQQTLYSDRFNWVEAQTNRPNDQKNKTNHAFQTKPQTAKRRSTKRSGDCVDQNQDRSNKKKITYMTAIMIKVI